MSDAPEVNNVNSQSGWACPDAMRPGTPILRPDASDAAQRRLCFPTCGCLAQFLRTHPDACTHPPDVFLTTHPIFPSPVDLRGPKPFASPHSIFRPESGRSPSGPRPAHVRKSPGTISSRVDVFHATPILTIFLPHLVFLLILRAFTARCE